MTSPSQPSAGCAFFNSRVSRWQQVRVPFRGTLTCIYHIRSPLDIKDAAGSSAQWSIDIRRLANYDTCQMIRSIPPGRKTSSPQYRLNVYRAKKQIPHYTSMRTSTLENLLAEAERLESEQVEVVKLLPYDEDLERLDKLQRVITQLKRQITLRVKKKTAQYGR